MILNQGQVSDAVTTILISFFLDHKPSCGTMFAMGKYKTWYTFGTVLCFYFSAMAFGDIFNRTNNKTTIFWFYSIAVIASQSGWSWAQISHLSLINEISVNGQDRIRLASSR